MPVASTGLGLMPALLFGGGQRSSRLHAQRRSGMQRSGAAKSWGCAASSASPWAGNSRPSHYGLAWTNWAAINGLAGHRRGTARGHAGARRLRLGLTWRRTCLLQTRHHVGTRRNYRTCRRLSSQIRTRWSCSQRHGRRWSRRFNGGRRRRSRRGWNGRRSRGRMSRRRCSQMRSSWRQRLARSRKYLTWPRRCRYRTRRHCAGA